MSAIVLPEVTTRGRGEHANGGQIRCQYATPGRLSSFAPHSLRSNDNLQQVEQTNNSTKKHSSKVKQKLADFSLIQVKLFLLVFHYFVCVFVCVCVCEELGKVNTFSLFE